MTKGSKQTEESKEKIRKTKQEKGTFIPKQSKEAKEKIKKAANERSPETIQRTSQNTELSKSIHRAVQGTMMDYLREALTKTDDKGHPYYQQFIDNFLKEAAENPNSQCGRMIGSGLFSENTLDKLDAQVNKMMAKDIEFARYRIRSTLFDKQRELFDNIEDPEICVVCSRRAGKTQCIARKIAETCLTPNSNVLYVNLTFTNAIMQMYDKVMEMLDIAELRLKRASKTEGIIELDNGCVIVFRGNSNKTEADKCQGYNYRRVFIDEIQSQINMNYLMEQILRPLLKDYKDPQVVYTGTPPRVPHTYCEKLWNMPLIKKYHWTMFDNPYIPNKESIIETECKRLNTTPDNSIIQREYYGNFTYDKESQVFKNRTYYTTLPNVVWEKAYIGVDYGDADYNALALCLKAGNKMYVAEERKFHRSIVSELINQILDLVEIAKKYTQDVSIYCDHNKKDVSRELAITYGLDYVFDAYKVDKDLAIDQLKDCMRNGTVLIKQNNPFDDECEQIVHPRDPDTDAILPGIDNVYHPDVLDAILYAFRQFIYDSDMKVDFHNKQGKNVKDDYDEDNGYYQPKEEEYDDFDEL